jgi:DNA-binding transcriptional ArsR family regulator
MQTKRSVVRKAGARSRKLERIAKGFANHRRIEMIELLGKKPELSVGEISLATEIELKTASEHLRRLALSGLVLKRQDGREVRHALTARAKKTLTFLRMLE